MRAYLAVGRTDLGRSLLGAGLARLAGPAALARRAAYRRVERRARTAELGRWGGCPRVAADPVPPTPPAPPPPAPAPPAPAPPPAPLFGAATAYAAGTNPHAVAAADVDRDGRLDLVVAAAGSNAAAILRGNGDGTFRPAALYPVGAKPKVVLPVDLDGDGDLDLASADQDGDSASVALGAGDGTFGAPTHLPACDGAHDVAAGDLNLDGKVDLVVACWGVASVVAVLRGHGDGTFEPQQPFAVAPGPSPAAAPHSVLLRDLDGDGRLDAIVAARDWNAVAILRGNGDVPVASQLATAVHYPVGTHPHQVRAADLDGDGALDLVTANDGADAVSLLRGNGDGTFRAAVSAAVGSVPKGVALGDVDLDGRVDVLSANTAGNYLGGTPAPGGDTVSLLLGDGAGGLAAGTTLTVGATPFSLALADLNGDGRVDLATANWGATGIPGSVTVLLHG
ncbi:MAG: VCBS repeat-containing protein [Thermoleophilia bacterium]